MKLVLRPTIPFDLYHIQTAEGKMDGKMNFMAIIGRLDNPKLLQAIKEFEDAVDFLFDKT